MTAPQAREAGEGRRVAWRYDRVVGFREANAHGWVLSIWPPPRPGDQWSWYASTLMERETLRWWGYEPTCGAAKAAAIAYASEHAR